jgi:hypothetical protein
VRRNALIDEGGCLCVVDCDTLMRAPSEHELMSSLRFRPGNIVGRAKRG